MSATDHADELLARIYAFMVRAANDPIITRPAREMEAIVTAWRLVSVMEPGLLPFDADQFRRNLVTQGAKKTAAAIVALAQSRWGGSGSSEPSMPPANATESELAAYQKSLDKYNRMQEGMIKIMGNRKEMRRELLWNQLR